MTPIADIWPADLTKPCEHPFPGCPCRQPGDAVGLQASEPTMPNLIRAVDVSSHQVASLPALRQWIADGCQLLIIKSYQKAESAALAKSTRDHVTIAQAAGCWTLPYVWLYRSVDPRESVRTSLELFRSTGEQPRILFLDCETYANSDGSTDPGPNVDQILAAADACRSLGVAPVIYTGNWWLAKLEGDGTKLAGFPIWLASYNGQADLKLIAPFGMRLVGHQFTDQPVDWSVFDLDALTKLSAPAPDKPDPLRAGVLAAITDLDALRERLVALTH